jgi:deoxyribodipyrimidine photo-lyase
LPAASPPIIVWFRRDLRLADHPALCSAALGGGGVVPVYVLDDETPGAYAIGGASRWWLAQSLRALGLDLEAKGSRLILKRGRADSVLLDLAKAAGARGIYFTRGYEPFHVRLENTFKAACDRAGLELRRFPGHLLVEPELLRTKSDEPYRVFTPFYRACLARSDRWRESLATPEMIPAPEAWPPSDRVEDFGLEPHTPDWASGLRAAWVPGEQGARDRLAAFEDLALDRYGQARDKPHGETTSLLSPHLAFGEISPVQVWDSVSRVIGEGGTPVFSEPFLRQIVWREFSYHLLFQFPDLPEKAFKPEFERFPAIKDKARLQAWQKGKTGYPIVDAGMRQLWQTGWMHNRVRLIVASFLIKHLLISWREGQAWFWDTLCDADLANNAASWQWVAGSGADAAPYFRIFNPVLQGEKFDPDGDYVRRFVPELAKLPASVVHRPWEADAATLKSAGVTLGVSYPMPVVDHAEARARALLAYETIKTRS